jgi:hypothetical protein
LGKGGGVHIAVEVRVELVVSEVVLVVDVKVMVFVCVVYTGDGLTVLVTYLVLQASVIVAAVVDVTSVSVEVVVEVMAFGIEVTPTVIVGVAMIVVGVPTVIEKVRTYANVSPSMTIYQSPSNIAVCRIGLVLAMRMHSAFDLRSSPC